MGAVILSFFAGTLSVLSPCVVPLLPIVVASALQTHRHGPLALAGGLVASSTVAGLFFASLSFSVGVDREAARVVASAFLALAGVILLVPRLYEGFARLASPIANAATTLTARLPAGLGGQFLLGVLLGAVWTPCTGPALAGAIALAARSESLLRAAAVMAVFSVGAAVPVLLLAYASRVTLQSRPRLAGVFAVGKPIVGTFLLLIGVLTLTGADKRVEAWMVDRMPSWLLHLTTAL